MKDLPDSFWGAIFILLACGLAGLALHTNSKDTAAVITMATGIVTGTFGYIVGKKDGQNQNPTQPK